MRFWSIGPPVAFLDNHRASLACVATPVTFGNGRERLWVGRRRDEPRPAGHAAPAPDAGVRISGGLMPRERPARAKVDGRASVLATGANPESPSEISENRLTSVKRQA